MQKNPNDNIPRNRQTPEELSQNISNIPGTIDDLGKHITTQKQSELSFNKQVLGIVLKQQKELEEMRKELSKVKAKLREISVK